MKQHRESPIKRTNPSGSERSVISISPALQRWSIAWCDHEDARRQQYRALKALMEESGEAIRAVEERGGRVEIHLLDGTTIVVRSEHGSIWVEGGRRS